MLDSLGFVYSCTTIFQICLQKSSIQMDFFTVIGTADTTMVKIVLTYTLPEYNACEISRLNV